MRHPMVLGAMRGVAGEPLSAMDERTLAGASAAFFGGAPVPEVPPPASLAATLDPDEREDAVRFLAVVTLVDGALNGAKIERARAYAAALGVDEPGLDLLVRSAHGGLREALACMMRKNIESLSGHPAVDDDFMAFFLPYRAAPDPALRARFEALGALPEGTLGRAYHGWYVGHGFAFPGDPDGLCWEFAVPHDSTHLLSGYDTSPHGELLVSTFTAGMHPHEPMEGHILPVLYSWHLGIRLNDVATSAVGAFDPERFWEAWRRGRAVTTDVFLPGWDFWSACERDLGGLREEYGVPDR